MSQYWGLRFHYYILYYSSDLDQGQYQIPLFIIQAHLSLPVVPSVYLDFSKIG